MSEREHKKSESAATYVFPWDDAEMKRRWELFTKFGNASATEMTNKNFDKWLKDASVMTPNNITPTVTGIAFSKVTGPKRKTLSYKECKTVLIHVAEDRAKKTKQNPQFELDDICEKLGRLEGPSYAGGTKPAGGGVVDRLTDVSKYTGSHKERFDPKTGQGLGKAGRADTSDSSGYVAGYKAKGTYEKTHDARSP